MSQPVGWAFCDGQVMAISENDTLFNLIGTTYGGDGQSTFALPDLRGRVPIHMGTQAGTNYVIGEKAGEESVTLTVQQMPAHNHALLATGNSADKTTPQGNVAASASVVNVSAYGTDQPTTPVSPASIGPAGGSAPHENLQPFACINFIISLFGVYPSQT
jgi:microcystin-dependent protein